MTGLYDLVGWILAGFYSFIPNYAVALILLGITFMVVVVPFTLKSTRSMLAMQKLQPKVKQLQEQHRNDKLALNQAVTELYKQEGVNPLGGCIPSLIPMPLLWVLYRVIAGLANKTKHCPGFSPTKLANACPLYLDHHTRMFNNLYHSALPGQSADMHAFGINLSQSAWTAITKGLGFAESFGTLFLLVVMIAANYYQQVQITNLNPMARQNQQMRFMRVFPIVFGIILIRFASALILYYAVSALFRVGQQWAMYRYDPKVKALVAQDINVVEARFSEIEHQPPKQLPAKQLPEARANGAPRVGQSRVPARRPVNVPSKASMSTADPATPPPVRRQGSRNRKRKRR